jgi:hypothetical protein
VQRDRRAPVRGRIGAHRLQQDARVRLGACDRRGLALGDRHPRGEVVARTLELGEPEQPRLAVRLRVGRGVRGEPALQPRDLPAQARARGALIGAGGLEQPHRITWISGWVASSVCVKT